MQETSVFRQIRNLLLVIFLGVGAAILVSAFFIYFYGPTGSYKLEKVLLNPQVAEGLRYPEENGKKLVFDHVEFLYYKNNWERLQLTQEQYQAIYGLIEGDYSQLLISEQLKNLFFQENPAILSLVVRKEGGVEERAFQEVQIASQGDYYRVQLHEARDQRQWAYFKHPGIYNKIFNAIGVE